MDESNFEQENIPKSPDDLAGSEEAESAAPQNPEMPVNESEEPVQLETPEAGLTDITNEEAGNSLPPEATANGEIEVIPSPEAVQEAEAAKNPTPEATAEQVPAGKPTPEVSEP